MLLENRVKGEKYSANEQLIIGMVKVAKYFLNISV